MILTVGDVIKVNNKEVIDDLGYNANDKNFGYAYVQHIDDTRIRLYREDEMSSIDIDKLEYEFIGKCPNKPTLIRNTFSTKEGRIHFITKIDNNYLYFNSQLKICITKAIEKFTPIPYLEPTFYELSKGTRLILCADADYFTQGKTYTIDKVRKTSPDVTSVGIIDNTGDVEYFKLVGGVLPNWALAEVNHETHFAEEDYSLLFDLALDKNDDNWFNQLWEKKHQKQKSIQ